MRPLLPEPHLTPNFAVTEPGGDLWTRLRSLTAARIGLARSGASLATSPMLDLRRAHARARDAVYNSLDAEALAVGLQAILPDASIVDSAAGDRRTYLMRPDLGRQLARSGWAELTRHAGQWDLAVVLVDGLSARAVAEHAVPTLAAALPSLRAEGWQIAPAAIVRQGRVAIGDAVTSALTAEAVVVLIGERPGLSTQDSLSAYLTWRPHQATTDADRNCISNIHPAGTSYTEAAGTLVRLLGAMRSRGLSGVALKDNEALQLAP